MSPEQPGPKTEQVDDDDSDLGMGSGQAVGDAGADTSGSAEASGVLSAYMRKKGIKDVDGLIAAAEANERKVSELGGQLRMVQATPVVVEPDMGPGEGEKVVWPEDPYDLMDKEKYKKFQVEMDQALERRVERGVRRQRAKDEQARMYQVALAKQRQNPKEFERLRPKMIELSKRPENLYSSLDELYEQAKAGEREDRQAIKDEIMRDMFGPDVDIEKMRAMVPRMQHPPEISRSGGGGAPAVGAPTDRQVAEKAIRDRILNAKRLEG